MKKLGARTLKARDRELEAKANPSLKALMKLRWEQTDGGGGYRYTEYARIVDRSAQVITAYAKAYALISAPGAEMSSVDALALGQMSEPQRIATTAAAAVLETTVAQIDKSPKRRPVLREARIAARAAVDQAVEEGADEDEQVQRAVAAVKKVAARQQDHPAERAARVTRDLQDPEVVGEVARSREGAKTLLEASVDAVETRRDTYDERQREERPESAENSDYLRWHQRLAGAKYSIRRTLRELMTGRPISKQHAEQLLEELDDIDVAVGWLRSNLKSGDKSMEAQIKALLAEEEG